MEKRATTNLIGSNLVTGELDNGFFLRKRGANAGQILLLLLVAILIGVATITINEKLVVTSIVFILFGFICWNLSRSVQDNMNMVTAAEFQNSLFASALGMNHDFTFIVAENEREIFYLDRPFQIFFPSFLKQKKRSLDFFLNMNKVSKEEQDSLSVLLKRNVTEDITVNMEIEGKSANIILSVEPIPRPKGFTVIRGRKL
ncbi:MAG: hypothetical protein R3D71_10750 [Rickettsiales bacterium]